MDIQYLSHKFLKYQLIILVGIFIVLEGFLGYNLYKIVNYTESYKVPEPITETDGISRRIDGVLVVEGQENLYPVAINIDNHFDAWPTFGLSQASVVYETLVEGKFTRFLAVYTPSKDDQYAVNKIGPVRSTRPYFLPLVKEYDALFAHSGGSSQALQEIEELEIHNLEEIAWWGPDYFWRVYSRSQPHNLFSSSYNLAQAVIDWELIDNQPEYRAWEFNQEIETDNYELANKIKIDFSEGELYDITYEYSTTTQSYLRWQNDEIYIDGLDKKQIQVKNLVIQSIPTKKIIDEEGRIELNVIGKGTALIFRDGIEIEGSWKKRDIESRTVFYDNKGDEVEFKPGNIWIAVVPGNREISVE